MRNVIRWIPVIALTAWTAATHALSPTFEIVGWDTNGWPKLAIGSPTNQVYTIECSDSLTNWQSVAVLHGREFVANPAALPFVDPGADSSSTRFYRVRSEPIEFEDDWRNQVFFPDDEFRNEPITFGLPETRWIKFAITTNEPTRVYYQNSWKYKFHYNFASARLPGFQGLTPIQFDEVSLHTNSQRIVLGAVLFSPHPEEREAGIQFVGQDPYTPEQIARWFELVRTTIQPLNELNVMYLPTFEQAATAESNRAFFEARGIKIGSLNNWDTGVNAYSTGWAMGRLVFVPGGEIAQAYATGTLKPDDILLTDAVPAEIPYVAGILTLAPSTPNSHVAILARSHAVPFVYLADAELRARAQEYVGRHVAVTAFPGYPQMTIRLLDASGVDPALRQEIIDSKLPEPLKITPKARYGSYVASTEALVPGDIQFFGGKAANFGFLRREIPSNSPPALAISFDLWDDFMSQTNAAGFTLRERIAARLSKYTYPPNIAALTDELETIRDMIEDTTVFTAGQQEAIAAALLAMFDPQVKIRFRSSTNVEDAENFTGAGLYDSYSGCLADDQDGDTAGPSVCDPTENNERGVFRAIRKVYASFYNDNAVLERMRHRVDESKVGMAILVHYSAPDPTEMANGVATINFTRSGATINFEGRMVTQKGAVSVTNPDGSALPEVVAISRFGGQPHATVREWSSLVPFGANVLQWDAEYKAFANLFARAAGAFQSYYPAKSRYTLDFEYKKLLPGVLQVKQIREIPSADPDTQSPTYLFNEPGEWQVFQGEYGSVFANHRLKGKFQLSTLNLKLTTNAIKQPVLGNIAIEYIHDGEPHVLSGLPGSFSNATHSVGTPDFSGTPIIDSWTITTSNNQQRVSLITTVRTSASPDESPLLTLADAQIEFRSVYSNAVAVLEFGPTTNLVKEEAVLLMRTQTTNAQSVEVTRTVPAEKGAAITTTFYWPQPPSGATAGYTAPLVTWKETRIEGLTTEPIVLRDYFSQTYRPEHHNFSENFLFEPALEPGIPTATLNELRARNIRQIYVFWGGSETQTHVYVSDEAGNWRPLSGKQAMN
jgi:hypothetical protein